MVSKKYNQFIQQQMRDNATSEKEKLIKICSFIIREYGIAVHREAICLFDKETDKFIKFASWITEEQFHQYAIQVPDLLFFVKGEMWIIEIDGYIHFTKESVALKDIERDRRYNAAGLNWRKVNEWEVLIKLGHKPNRSATAKEVITEVKEIMTEIY